MTIWASKIAMLRPKNFGFNSETAASNVFQNKNLIKNLQKKVLTEFDYAIEKIKSVGIDIHVFEDRDKPVCPDAVFLNNWFSIHPNSYWIYNMLATNRNMEKRDDIIRILGHTKTRCELSSNFILEGTGSLVLDRAHNLAYASLSSRTQKKAVELWCDAMDFTPLIFSATNTRNHSIYHTNVLMAVGEHFVVCCLEAIKKNERALLINSIQQTNKTLIEISYHQMNAFCGNIIQLNNMQNELVLVMSQRAKKAFTNHQMEQLVRFNNYIISPNVETIETVGGGGIRCMIAEVF